MKKLLALLLIATYSVTARAADDIRKLDNRLEAARAVLDQVMSVPDKAIPNGIARKAVCIAVVPGMIKGAFILGAEYGQGVVTCRTEQGWSGPVFIRMAGGSWGFQIGGQGTDLILVAVNERGMQSLLHDKFKIGGDVAAAAGPVGRDAQASTDIDLKAELLTWSRSRGLFAGIDLNGVSVSQNRDDTENLYGVHHPFERILHGHVPPPASAGPFLQTVEQYFGRAQAESGQNDEMIGRPELGNPVARDSSPGPALDLASVEFGELPLTTTPRQEEALTCEFAGFPERIRQ
jgi:lipid-binding SYLF domain-containing protein